MKKQSFFGAGSFHFVTFVCNGRRKLLSAAPAKQIIVSVLNSIVLEELAHVSGFAVMPDHVHAVLWFDDDSRLSKTMQLWKGRSSSKLRIHYEAAMPDILKYLKTTRNGREFLSFRERRYYDFNIDSQEKLVEKLNYMHANPVKLGLVDSAIEYEWSSARWYENRESVGVKIEPGI